MSEIHVENSSSFRKHVTSATIYDIREIIIGRKTKPVFIITVQRGEDTSYEITKEYKDFFELQCSILDTFPAEGGQGGYERIIPHLPGRKIFRRDDLRLAQERKPELNKYMNELLRLSANISQCKLVLDFFAKGEVENMNKKDLINDAKEGSTSCTVSESVSDVTTLQCYVNTSYNSDGEQNSA